MMTEQEVAAVAERLESDLTELRDVVARSVAIAQYEPTPDRQPWDDAWHRYLALRESASITRAVACLALAQIALRLRVHHTFGLSAIYAGACLGLLVVAGVARRSRTFR